MNKNRIEVCYVSFSDADTMRNFPKGFYFLKWITKGAHMATSAKWGTKRTAVGYAKNLLPKGWKAYDNTGKSAKEL